MIDATMLRGDRMTGVERYTDELIRAQLNLDTGHEWHIALREGYEPSTWDLSADVTLYRVRSAGRVFRDQVALPALIARVAPDLVHFPAFAPPVATPRKPAVVLTVFDVAYWMHPDTLSWGGRFYHRPLLDLAWFRHQLDAVLTVSHASADALRRLRPAMAAPKVTYPGTRFHHAPGPPLKRYGLDRPFFLAVGTREPRKNLSTLIAAYQLVRRSRPAAPLLAIVGRAGWGTEDDVPASLEAYVRVLERVPDEDLAVLYSHCIAFVLPSVHEGFGLPLLEAMASGAPCIASDIPVLRELGKAAVLYADPYASAAFADRLTYLLDNDEVRRTMREASYRRARYYTWNRCARATVDAYEDTATGIRSRSK